MNETPSRRSFVKTLAGGAAMLAAARNPLSAAAAANQRNIKLGFDNFSIRSLGWKADRILDYANEQQCDVVMFSDLDVYESHDPEYLKDLRKKADGYGILIHAGTGGICPTSSRYNDKYGAPIEHLSLAIRVSEALGSPVVRCYLGHGGDRRGEGGIFRHIESTVEVLKAVEKKAKDADVKIAVENHAGDLQAWELVKLIEAAGADFVGATLDSGNATWTLESPMLNLEILGPHAVSTGMRDSALWESENGAYVEWTNMGDGHVDWNAYLDTYETLCPDTPFILEIISGINPREYPYLEDGFWEPYPDALAAHFYRFVRMAERGKEFVQPEGRPAGENSRELSGQQQLWDLEQSLTYCKERLGLGLKG